MRTRPVPLLSPAATIRRRTHAFAFNLASVGREDLLDGRFAPEAAENRQRIKAHRSGPLLTLLRFRLRASPQMQRLSTLMWQPLDLGRPKGLASRFTATRGSLSLLPFGFGS
jgi:hypothetical protein